MIGNSALIIEDDPDVTNALYALLEDEFKEVVSESSPNRINAHLSRKFDIILLDMNFSAGVNTGNEGLFWLNQIMERQPDASVIMMTAYGNINLAVEAMKRGAKDFILKPWENEKLLSTIQANVVKNKTIDSSANQAAPFSQWQSAPMISLQEEIEKVARTDASVLLLGENGTGKEVFANEIHRLSKRSNYPFISIDLSTIPISLFESELFGHIRGSFTDAKADKKGRFELANKGTLFLDEIGNVSLEQQVKLLTAVQNQKITPVGSTQTFQLDTRLISATNAPLAGMVRNNTFRQDLLYRINTITLTIPPLRERGADIKALTHYFLKRYAVKYNRANIAISDEAIHAISRYTWPGNVRELQHTIEKAIILCDGDEITSKDLRLSTSSNPILNQPKGQTLEALEKEAMIKALTENEGNVVQAAKALGITRQTLYNKMKKYGI